MNRLQLDYKALSEWTLNDTYPLPRIQEALEAVLSTLPHWLQLWGTGRDSAFSTKIFQGAPVYWHGFLPLISEGLCDRDQAPPCTLPEVHPVPWVCAAGECQEAFNILRD